MNLENNRKNHESSRNKRCTIRCSNGSSGCTPCTNTPWKRHSPPMQASSTRLTVAGPTCWMRNIIRNRHQPNNHVQLSNMMLFTCDGFGGGCISGGSHTARQVWWLILSNNWRHHLGRVAKQFDTTVLSAWITPKCPMSAPFSGISYVTKKIKKFC